MDKLARVVVEPGRWAYRQIVKEFGKEVLAEDGTLDRKKLGAIVFNDRSARKKLEKYTHYPIFWEMFKMIFVNYWKGVPYIILDVPLLFETGIDRFTNTVIVVTTTPEEQLQRLMIRESLSEDDAKARINAQMPLKEKEKRADIIIDNSGPKDQIEMLANNAINKAKQTKDKLPRNTLIACIGGFMLLLVLYLRVN